jgi:peptidoglycan hydrolase-like protein with peptidoglycan-binding domain
MDEGPIGRADAGGYSRSKSGRTIKGEDVVMKRFLAVMFTVALGAALTVPAIAQTVGEKVKTGVQKTKDAADKVEDKIEDKAKDVKDRMLGRKTEGPEDHHGAMKHQHVMAAQQALKDKGHDPGMIDGKMGSRTRAAVADYQKAEGLKETGRLDAETRAKLGV